MELKDFIAKTVSEILNGVEEASKLTNKKVGLYSTSKENRRHIEFDIAITTEVNDGKNIDGGIKVIDMIQLGGNKTSETRNSEVNRIKFGIRIR